MKHKLIESDTKIINGFTVINEVTTTIECDEDHGDYLKAYSRKWDGLLPREVLQLIVEKKTTLRLFLYKDFDNLTSRLDEIQNKLMVKIFN